MCVCVCVCTRARMCACALHAQSYLTLCCPCAIAHQAPLSMEFSRQEYWIWLPFPSPGDLSHPGIELASLVSPALAADSSPLAPLGKPLNMYTSYLFSPYPLPKQFRQPISFHCVLLKSILPFTNQVGLSDLVLDQSSSTASSYRPQYFVGAY